MGQHKAMEIIRIEGEPAPGPDDGHYGYKALWEFLESIHTNPTILRNTVDCPAEYNIKHNGKCWTMEVRALVDA
jgi:hypothetical protein